MLANCAEFVDCRFSGRIERSKFFGRPVGACAAHTNRKRNEFSGTDFRMAQLFDTGFQFGIDIDAELWPESDEYVIVRDAASG